MQLRRDSGTRRLPAVEGPRTNVRRGPDYLIAHACFACRKSFKLAPREERTATCPQCAGVLHEMGRHFRAPPRRDRGQWEKVRRLHAAGFLFCNGRGDAPALPQRLADVDAFLRDNPMHPLRVRR